jgi:hypothetical protein
LNFGGFVAVESAFVVDKFEFLVEGSAISRHPNRVVYINLGGVRQIDSFIDGELVGDLSKVDYLV